MEPVLVVGLACAALLIMLALRVHVAIALLVAGLLGLILLDTSASPGAVVQSVPFSTVSRYSWTVVPMFVLMGAFATASGLIGSLFRIAHRMFYRLPGGVGLAAVAACAGFSAVSGSSVAAAASIGPVAGKEMHRAGYKGSFAAGLVASAGTLGVLIPPSIVLVIFGIVTGESIALLLIAGIVPGIISALVIGALVVLLSVFRPQTVMADVTPRKRSASRSLIRAKKPTADVHEVQARSDDAHKNQTPSPSDSLLYTQVHHSGFGALLRLLILFLSVVGGIYTGIATVTEAAAVGAAVAFLIALIDVAPLGLKNAVRMFARAFQETAVTTGMLFLIVVGASVFSYFFVLARVPAMVSDWVLGLDVAPLVIVGIILLTMIPLGMFLDPMSIILIVVPLTYPIVVTEFGFSGIWYAILVVKMIEIGLVTPPVGLNVFVVAGVMKDITTTSQAFRGVTWFVIADILLVTVFFFFPELITMWLPVDRL